VYYKGIYNTCRGNALCLRTRDGSSYGGKRKEKEKHPSQAVHYMEKVACNI
jgi:hypothetical protein